MADKSDLRASGVLFCFVFLKFSSVFEIKRMIRSYSVKWLVCYFLFPWLQIRQFDVTVFSSPSHPLPGFCRFLLSVHPRGVQEQGHLCAGE